MKTKHIVLVLSALLFGAGLCQGQMIQRNYNGTGIIYANTSGVTEIGNAPTTTGITFLSPNLTTPVFTGTITGTYTLGGTPTLTAPVLGAATATSIAFGSQTADHFIVNASAAASPQAPAASTRTYITGSQLVIPATGLKVGAILHWCFDMTKTAAGSASSTIDIAFGTAGTTADTAQVSFTKPAGTAAADEGVVTVECVIQSINASTGVAVGTFTLTHNLASTGHAGIPCVAVNTSSSGFNTVTPTSVGLCITTGASDAITINQCSAWARGL